MHKVIVHTPEKKSNVYIARLTTCQESQDASNNRYMKSKVKLVLNAVKLVSISPMDKGGHLLKIYVSDEEAVDALNTIDVHVKEETKLRNGEWFNNTLDDQTIETMWRPAINAMNHTMSILVSDTKEPNIYKDGELVDSIQHLCSDGLTPGTTITLQIEAHGVFFYPTKFGVRWFARLIHVLKDDGNRDTDVESTDWVDRTSIEQSWTEDVHELESQVEKDIDALTAQIRHLDDLKRSVQNELALAKACPRDDPEWNTRLRTVAKKCTKYYSGEGSI